LQNIATKGRRREEEKTKRGGGMERKGDEK
jgi:hypothetical protein